jgi:Flp pilus assembly pilin Flp
VSTPCTPPQSERGQTIAEYSTILAVLAVAVAVALTTFSGQIADVIGAVGSSL